MSDTHLPDGLVLVHERGDHYSRSMTKANAHRTKQEDQQFLCCQSLASDEVRMATKISECDGNLMNACHLLAWCYSAALAITNFRSFPFCSQ
jgi:hypothetical protein